MTRDKALCQRDSLGVKQRHEIHRVDFSWTVCEEHQATRLAFWGDYSSLKKEIKKTSRENDASTESWQIKWILEGKTPREESEKNPTKGAPDVCSRSVTVSGVLDMLKVAAGDLGNDRVHVPSSEHPALFLNQSINFLAE